MNGMFCNCQGFWNRRQGSGRCVYKWLESVIVFIKLPLQGCGNAEKEDMEEKYKIENGKKGRT